MTPLLFAAALAIAPAPPQPVQAIDGGGPLFNAPLRRLAPNQFIPAPPSVACSRLATQTVAPDGVRIFKRLDQLPWGVLEHAVWRTVSGCPVREIVFGGQTYYVASSSPRIERLDPAAHN
jgi:hypothetical protein